MVAQTSSTSIMSHGEGDALVREPLLRACAVTVDYPGVRALDAVTLDFHAGQIHAVVGENGAGKSTLMNVLSGVVRPTSGALVLRGSPVRFSQPSDAIRAGIAMVHQELNLVPTLDVAENILLGREPTRFLGIAVDRNAQRARAAELLEMLGAELNVGTAVCDLSIAQGQFVEIAKCLASDARIFIFDEPTAVLGEREAQRLFAVMRRLRDEGCCVIFISHHLDEILAIGDQVSVLRDGRLAQSLARDAHGVLRDATGSPADVGSLARAMVGREIGAIYPPKKSATDLTAAIELVNFGLRSESPRISLAVAAGEIVGIAGLVGSGRTEIAEAIVGLRQHDGLLRVHGREQRFSSPRSAMRAGVAYVSEDRKARGLHVSLSSIANMTLPSLDTFSRMWGMRVDDAAERTTTQRWIDALRIHCARPMSPISSLSGGNQQKFALARWLETKPKVLIIDEPTRGVDVGARGEIYRIIARLAADGLACIVISSELSEVIGISHRVLVMRGGRIAGELSRQQLLLSDCQERTVRIASGLPPEREQRS